MTNFYQQYKSIEPWLQTSKKPESGKEYLQSVDDRKKLVRCKSFRFLPFRLIC